MKLKIVSDGTNAGTHLVDEDTGQFINGISRITWEATAKNFLTKVVVELNNIPIEVVSKAEVDLYEYGSPNYELTKTKTFEKEIKIISEHNERGSIWTTIYDNQTNEVVGAIQKASWEATPHERIAKLDKIKLNKRDDK